MREISAEKLSYVIAKAREMESEAKGRAAKGPKRAAAGAVKSGDDGCAAARAELFDFIKAMGEDEQCELIALAWVGRGKFTREEWRAPWSRRATTSNSRPPIICSAIRNSRRTSSSASPSSTIPATASSSPATSARRRRPA